MKLLKIQLLKKVNYCLIFIIQRLKFRDTNIFVMIGLKSFTKLNAIKIGLNNEIRKSSPCMSITITVWKVIFILI